MKKHIITQKSYLIDSKWECTCGQEGAGPDEKLKHQLLTMEGELKEEMTLKLEWTITYKHGLTSWSFFEYLNAVQISQGIIDIGECVTQHLEAGFKLKSLETSLRMVTMKEYEDWKAFISFTEGVENV